jgi:hypothetical protein
MTEQEEFEFRLRLESEQATSVQPTAPSSEGYLAEAARQGFAGTVGALTGAANVMREQVLRPTGGQLTRRNPIAPFVAPPGAQEQNQAVLEAYRAGREPVYTGLMELMGSTGAQPQTGGQRIAAKTVEAMTSPENYLFPPVAAVRRLGMLGQALLRPAEQAVVGGGAEAGGQAGQAAGEKAGAPGVGQFVGSLFGGMGAGYGFGSVAKAVPITGKALDLVKDQWSKVKGTIPEDELLRDVDNRISNIFIAAGAADPTFMTTLLDAAKAQKGVSLKAPGGVEVQMPLSAMLADNPVINNLIQRLSAKDPVFRAQYGNQYNEAKDALLQNQIRLFGDPSKVQVNVAGPSLEKIQIKKVKSIDDQIADLSKDQTIDPTLFGQRVSNLVAQKEKAARKDVEPLYAEAFNLAKKNNVELPSSSVDDIYSFVAGEQASDIFKTFPSIYNRVRAKFRPTTIEPIEPSAILTAEGKPMTPGTPGGVKFSAATVEDLDSLKREINAQLRKTNDPADIRLLTELKGRVGGHIDNLDAEFVTAYRNADNAYLQKVGLPFSAETLKSVDRKKFVEQITPALIGNKSNVSQFIDATGQEGTRLARDAFLDSFTKAALKNDVIDPKAANKWLKANQGGTSMIPGLDDELRASVNNVQNLINQRSRLNADFQRVAGEQIISKEGFKNSQELISKMYGDINFTNKFMSNSGYGQNKDAVNAVRSFMLDDIVRSGDPMALLNDRSKAAIFNRVFGPTYAQKVQDFATVSERLLKDITNVPFKTETVPKTSIESVTGIPPEQIISRIYNPVSGITYAVTSLISKFWANKASAATEEKLKALLLNPSDAVKVFQAVQPRVSGFDQQKIQDAIDIGKKYGIQWVDDAVNDLRTGAARGAVQGMQQDQQPEQRQSPYIELRGMAER